MNPTPEAITLIRDRVTDWASDNAAIADALNGATVPNPEAQVMVPVYLDKNAALMTLSPESQGRFLNYVNLRMVFESFDLQDHSSCVAWVYAMVAAGKINEMEVGPVVEYINTQVPDPNWQATVPAPLQWLGRLVDSEDISEAREAE